MKFSLLNQRKQKRKKKKKRKRKRTMRKKMKRKRKKNFESITNHLNRRILLLCQKNTNIFSPLNLLH